MRISRVLCVALLAISAARLAGAAAPPDVIEHGEYLARAGNCVVCHTGPDQRPFAGGLKMAIPSLGAIYATNITPDKETGIGNYTFEDFERAMRHGVAKDGHYLYPAMPYPSYAKVSETDLRALYAFFMESVPAVKRVTEPSEIPWPLNMRWPLAVWNFFFLDKDEFKNSTGKDGQWNRGAYLVEGLGHCGSCHTPRGLIFQEKALDAGSDLYLAGAELDLWYAPSLRGDVRTGLGRWSKADVAEFMKTGHNSHGTAFGTMIDVINNSTQHLTDSDLDAIAVYLTSLPGKPGQANWTYTYDAATTDALRSGNFTSSGARIYVQQCVSCHGLDGGGHAPFLPPLAANPTILDANPASIINIVLNGSARIVVNGLPDSYRMPQYRVLLKDQEIADVLSFIRQAWGNDSPATIAADVAKIRASTNPANDAVVILKMR